MGGIGAIIGNAAVAGSGKLFLADTFVGIVKASNDDTLYKGGEHSDTDEEIVHELFRKTEVKNYQILKGIYPNDFPSFETNGIKLCHIDVDTYLSASDIVDFIWPKMMAGGVLVFDDYGFFGCEEITSYVNELKFSDSVFIHNLNGHALLIKRKVAYVECKK